MGQCLSFAKAVGKEVLEEVIEEATASASAPTKPQAGAPDEEAPPPAEAPTAPAAEAPSRGSGAVYPSLPDGAERHTVRNVYDGDTLTLYYGASDTVTCGARLSVKEVLRSL